MVELLAAQWTHVHVCLLVAGRFSYTKVLSRNGNFLALFFTAKAVALCRGMRGGGSLGKGDEGRGVEALKAVAPLFSPLQGQCNFSLEWV